MQAILYKIISSGAGVVCPTGYSGSCDTGLPTISASNNELKLVLQSLFGIVAAITVLIIVIAGFRFVVSQGNSDNVSRARETIIYALVGLVVCLTAEAIVSFVLFKA